MRSALVGLYLVFATGVAGHAEDKQVLVPGLYEVQMRLELPHLEDMAVSKTVGICINGSDTRGIVVLSDNNPLSRCPPSNIHNDGHKLTFDLVCDGPNQAIASADFALGADRFDGVFRMKMGGKNMTMFERQTGRRTGACR